MENLRLVIPTMEYKDQVMSYREECFNNNEFHLSGCAGLEDVQSYEEWIDFENRLSSKYGTSYVPSSVFLAVRNDDNKVVGIIDIRQKLSEFLLKYGGHIGYSVLPSERLKGYAKKMLKLALEECIKLGIDRVLITCDKNNVGSYKTILANGGVLENEVKDDVNLGKSGTIQRYWINLKSNIKMIITDLDETLLHTDKYISEYTIDVLRKCQTKGIKIVFATARSIQASSKFCKQFMPDIFIGYGGALVLAEDKAIHRFDISADISSKLINECLKEPDILYILATNENVSYTNKINPNDKDISHYQCVDFSTNNNISYLKISVVATNPNIVESIASTYPMLDLLRYTGEDLYRFANRNAVKWNAIKAVSDYYNISTDMFIAFGDDKNDLEMIKNCGVGVAVENAIDEVKSVAKHICETNNNDGVAKWIEKNILGEV